MLAEGLDDFTHLSPSRISLDEDEAIVFSDEFLLCFLKPFRFFCQEDVNFAKPKVCVVLAPHLEFHFRLVH